MSAGNPEERIISTPLRFSVLLIATTIALVSARPFAGGWNDESRLATVESLVDYHTWEISRSIFNTTYDKLQINGQWYSDKSPAPALLLAGEYQILQWTTGLRVTTNKSAFCWWMTILSSGIAYVLSAWFTLRMAETIGLSIRPQILLVASFMFATLALPYARHVNNHILILTAASGMTFLIADEKRPNALALGALAGLAYAIELAAGPVLLMCTFALLAWRYRRARELILFAAGALPFLILHHAINFRIGGTFGPANSIPQYLAWPGSQFTAQNMSGVWQHRDFISFVSYGLSMMFGKNGFIVHNLPTLIVGPALWTLYRRNARRDAIAYSLTVVCGTWLLCAATTNNSSGMAASIRWFLPLLAPLFLLIAMTLRVDPSCEVELLTLTVPGIGLMAFTWWQGPWMRVHGYVLWPFVGVASFLWLVVGCRRLIRSKVVDQESRSAIDGRTTA